MPSPAVQLTADEVRRQLVGKGESQFVGIAETARVLGVSYSAVWDSLRRGDFPVPSIQIGAVWRISRPGLERLINGEVTS